MPAMPNSGRKKVRCPKCTALFSEPAKAVYECPICACRLSANGAVASTASLSSQVKDKEFGQMTAFDRTGDEIKVESQEACSGEASDTLRAPHIELCDENRGALLAQIYKKEQQPIIQNEELHVVSDNDGKKGKPAVDATLVDTNDVPPENGGAGNKRLDMKMFQNFRCEFSFKYSLEGAPPVETSNSRKMLPVSKLSSSTPPIEASDAPSYTPLRFEISDPCEENFDQSEHERYSLTSETDGSESDFDFPAPWADGLQNKVLPDSFVDNELIKHNSKQVAFTTPHQLEFHDVYDASANEEYVSRESDKYSEESDTELRLQAGGTCNAASHPEKENELRDTTETFRIDLPSQVHKLADIISSVVTLNHNQNLVESLAPNVSSSQQGPQFASRPRNISSADEAQSPSHEGPLRRDIKASDMEAAFDSRQLMFGGMGNGNPSPVLQGPLGAGFSLDPSKAVRTYAKPHVRDKNTHDHPLLRDTTEIELDLYSNHQVDEWQHRQVDDSPSNADDHIPIMESHNYHSDLEQQKERHSSIFSDYAVSSIPLANSQPYVITNHYVPDNLLSGASSSSHLYTHQVPLQPYLGPPKFQDHTMVAPFAYHTVPKAWMMCSLHQHPHIQDGFCAYCAICPGSIGWSSGHADQWSYHQAHHGPAPAMASSLVACTQGPINLSHRHDFPCAGLSLQISEYGRLSRYPPLPTDGAPPFISCKECSRILQVPLDVPSTNGFVQKLRCSACGRVNKFSVKQHRKQQQVVSSLPSPEMPLLHFATCSVTSHVHHALPPMSPWQHEESSRKATCPVDANVFRSKVLSLQGGDYLRSKPSDYTVDSSISTGAHYLKSTSSVTGIVSAHEHRMLGSTDTVQVNRRRQDTGSSLHVVVDEKDEGLDFGAPRSSDGDSFDQSESRRRSPEYIQAQNTCAREVFKVYQSGESIPEGQEKPGSPLLVLINQESTRFMLSLDPRATSEECKSASWSPASESPHIDNKAQICSRKKERASSHSLKGHKYITGLLKRSLKDLSKGRH